MPTADWYYAQADLLRGRAECLPTARPSPRRRRPVRPPPAIPAMLTWDCPVGREFDQLLAGYCGDLQAAIDTLRANALGLSGDADDYERRGAAELSRPTDARESTVTASRRSTATNETDLSSRRPRIAAARSAEASSSTRRSRPAADPSMSLRPSSQHRRCRGAAWLAASGRPVAPIGWRALYSISIRRRSSRTYSSGQSSGGERRVTEVGVVDDDLAQAAEREVGVGHRLPG